jgi:hypothetical protein
VTVPASCTRFCCCRWHPTRTCWTTSAPRPPSLHWLQKPMQLCVCECVCVCVCVCVLVCVCLVMGERLKKRTEKRSFRVELVRVDQKSLSLLILATFLNSFVRLLVCLFVCLFNWLTDMSKKENVASNIRNNNSEQIVLQLISRTS